MSFETTELGKRTPALPTEANNSLQFWVKPSLLAVANCPSAVSGCVCLVSDAQSLMYHGSKRPVLALDYLHEFI